MTSEIIDENEVTGYVCPSCRMVFAAIPSSNGNGVICPGCESLLKIPSESDQVAEIKVIENPSTVTPAVSPTKQVLSFEDESSKESSEEQLAYSGNDYSLKFIVPLLTLSLIVLGGVGYLFLRPSVNTDKAVTGSLLDLDTQTNQDGAIEGIEFSRRSQVS